jgi:predicted RNA binding protein YcfA (HicA-like mRNA interferase family)
MREISIRDFQSMLKEHGFSFARKAKGSHEVWENDNGISFVFPITKKSVKSGIVWQFNRLLKTTQSLCN